MFIVEDTGEVVLAGLIRKNITMPLSEEHMYLLLPYMASGHSDCIILNSWVKFLRLIRPIGGFQSRDMFDTWRSTLNGNTVHGLS